MARMPTLLEVPGGVWLRELSLGFSGLLQPDVVSRPLGCEAPEAKLQGEENPAPSGARTPPLAAPWGGSCRVGASAKGSTDRSCPAAQAQPAHARNPAPRRGPAPALRPQPRGSGRAARGRSDQQRGSDSDSSRVPRHRGAQGRGSKVVAPWRRAQSWTQRGSRRAATCSWRCWRGGRTCAEVGAKVVCRAKRAALGVQEPPRAGAESPRRLCACGGSRAPGTSPECQRRLVCVPHAVQGPTAAPARTCQPPRAAGQASPRRKPDPGHGLSGPSVHSALGAGTGAAEGFTLRAEPFPLRNLFSGFLGGAGGRVGALEGGSSTRAQLEQRWGLRSPGRVSGTRGLEDRWDRGCAGAAQLLPDAGFVAAFRALSGLRC